MEKRNRYTAEFKAKVVLELLTEEATLNQVATKYQLNPQMISQWKSDFVKNAPLIFTKGKDEVSNTLDMLTQDGVSLKKQQYTTVDGVEYPIGKPWRRAYANSVNGRAQVEAEVAEPYKTAIFAVWGDTPTAIEEV